MHEVPLSLLKKRHVIISLTTGCCIPLQKFTMRINHLLRVADDVLGSRGSVVGKLSQLLSTSWQPEISRRHLGKPRRRPARIKSTLWIDVTYPQG